MKNMQSKFEGRIIEAMAECAYGIYWRHEGGPTVAYGDIPDDQKAEFISDAKTWLAAYGSILNRLVAEDMVGRGLIPLEEAREELLSHVDS